MEPTAEQGLVPNVSIGDEDQHDPDKRTGVMGEIVRGLLQSSLDKAKTSLNGSDTDIFCTEPVSCLAGMQESPASGTGVGLLEREADLHAAGAVGGGGRRNEQTPTGSELVVVDVGVTAAALWQHWSGIRRRSSPGLLRRYSSETGLDQALVAGGQQRAAARVLSEGQLAPSASRLSVGERPTPSLPSLGQHSIGEDVSVDQRRSEKGEAAGSGSAFLRADRADTAAGSNSRASCREPDRTGATPFCRCTACLDRTRPIDDQPTISTVDPGLQLLSEHAVQMMQLHNVSESDRRQLICALQTPVPGCSQQTEEHCDPFPFHLLPLELKLKVFSYCTPKELCTSVFPVCKEWYTLGQDPLLWQHLNIGSDTVVSNRTAVRLASFAVYLKSLTMEARRQADQVLFQVADTCSQLRHLTAKFCDGLSSVLLEVLVKHCPNIETLDFEGSRFSDQGCVVALTELRRLRLLNVSHCARLEDSDMEAISSRCSRLEELNVDGIGYLSDAAFLGLVRLAGERLTQLVLDGESLTDVGFSCIGQACHQLRVLAVSFADNMTDASLSALRRLHLLLRLKIRRGHQLSAPQLAALFTDANMPHMLHLDLSECSNLDDGTVEAITSNCPLLTCLALSWCWEVTDAGLEAIVGRLRLLRVLELVGVVRLTGRCLCHIPEQLPDLRYLDLEQCSDIHDLVIERVVRRRPELQVLDYYGDVVEPRPVEMETWAQEVGSNPQQLQLPFTVNFVLLKDQANN